MLDICRTSCQWRNLLVCCPPWAAVHGCLARWQAAGIVERPTQANKRATQLVQARLPTLSRALVATQNVQLAPRLGPQRGLDAPKRASGRQRRVLCNPGGRTWQVAAPVATCHARRGGQALVAVRHQFRPAWGSQRRVVSTDSA